MKTLIKKYLCLPSLIFLFSWSASAQEVLSPQGAVTIGLKNNYSINIAKNSRDITENNASLGNAGVLPTLDATGSASRSVNNTTQEYSNGTSVDVSGAVSKNYAAGINLNWTIFDGLKMFASLEQLKELHQVGESNYKLTVEQNINDILSTYYDIVRQKQVLEATQRSVTISKERLRITQSQKDVGTASKFDVLRAQVDMNGDKSSLMNQELTLQQAKTRLNQLLGRDVKTKFDVIDTIDVKTGLSYNDLFSTTMQKNNQLLLAEQNKNVAQAQLRLERGDLFPVISLNLGYNYSRSESGAGFFKSSNTTGITYGVSASFNLFDGLNTRRRIENAEVSIESSELALKQVEDQVKALFENTYLKYQNSLQLVKLESENYKAAEENANIALEKLKVGSITPVDFRQVQLDLMNAKSRLLSAEYDAKTSETNLLQISGQLVKSSE
jgi:outer membrane protein TolC